METARPGSRCPFKESNLGHNHRLTEAQRILAMAQVTIPASEVISLSGTGMENVGYRLYSNWNNCDRPSGTECANCSYGRRGSTPLGPKKPELSTSRRKLP